MTSSQHEFRQAPETRSGSLREKMPGVTAWIDSLCDAFGKEMVDEMIRTGLKKGTFWAVENGNVVGRAPADVREKHFAELSDPKPPGDETGPEPAQPVVWVDRRWPSSG